MTTPSLHGPAPRPAIRSTNTRLAPHSSRPWTPPALLAAALLAACGSTPLPPWPSKTPIKAPIPSVPRATVVPAPLGMPARTGVVTTPVLAPATAATQAPAQQLATGSAAIDARFPEPATRYSTPGLAAQRRAFTTPAELAQWLAQLATAAARRGTQASVLTLGASQRGEPLLALVLTRASGTDPASLDASKRPTALLIGQQHGDEPAGSEALLVIAQELAHGLLEPLLDRINVVIVPRANPDGASAGTRATANGVDMDRDHLLLNTPEAQALAALARDYRPILVLDAQEFPVVEPYLQKFKALRRHDALLQYATTANVPEFLTKASQEWYHAPMVRALKAQNLSSDWYHATSSRPDDLGMAMGGTQPDSVRNVNGLKNAVSLLVATRGGGIERTHLQRRVHTQITAISSALHSTAERAAKLEQVRSYVVRDTTAQACHDQVIVEAEPTPGQRELTLLDPETGAERVLRVDWSSSLNPHTLKSRARPCGYWLAQSADTAVQRLKLLGVQVLRVAEPGSLLADSYREASRDIANGESPVRTQVTLVRSAIDVPAGSYYVPLNQPLANLAVAALEPDTQYSYFANRLIDRLTDTARTMSTPSLLFEESD